MICKLELKFLKYFAFSLFGLFFLLPPAFSNELTIVKNPDQGISDKNNSKNLDFVEDLIISGIDENKNNLFGVVNDIAVNSQGDIYILDHSNCKVHVFDSNGLFLLSFGQKGPGSGEFISPSAIEIDEHDLVYVADKNRVDVFDINGGLSTSFQLIESGPVMDLKLDSAGNLFVCSFEVFDQNIIHKYNPQGEYLISFCDSYAKGTEIDVVIEGTFAGGHIDIDEKNIIYFTQNIPYEIRKFTSEGELLCKIYRDNSFIKSPDDFVKFDGDRMSFSAPSASYSIVVISDDYFINIVHTPRIDEQPTSTIIDFYSPDGQLSASKRFDKPVSFKCKDQKKNLYAIDYEDHAKVIRYQIAFN
jgi:hypothetical protein